MRPVARSSAAGGWRLGAVAGIVALSGCGSPPAPAVVTPDRAMDVSADEVTVPLLLPGTVEATGQAPGPTLASATLEQVCRAVAPKVGPAPPVPAAPSPLETVEATRRYVRGRAAAAGGDLLVAARELRMSLTEDPKSAATLEELGRVLGRLGDAAGAAECHERLLVLRPRDPEALFSSGVAAASRGDLPRAIDRLATLHGLEPSERSRGLAGFRPEAATLADLALGRALATLGADAATVEVLARAADEVSPDVPPSMRADLERTLGDSLARIGDLDRAAAAWDRAAAIPGTGDPLLPRRMWAAVRLDRASAAAEALIRGVDLLDDPDEAVALARWLARVRPREAAAAAARTGDRRVAAALQGSDFERANLAAMMAADPAGVPAEVLRERFAALEADAALAEALRLVSLHPGRAEACAAALVRSGATGGGLLAALDRSDGRPGRGVLEPALAAALGDESRLTRLAESIAAGAGGIDEIAAVSVAIARLGDERLVEGLVSRLERLEGIPSSRRAAILASLSEAARGAGDAIRARELADRALATHRHATSLAAVVRLALDGALSRPEASRESLRSEALPLIEEATADPEAPDSAWKLRLAIVDAVGSAADRQAVRAEARRARPGTALDRQLGRDALVQSGRVAEALDRAAIRASAAPTDLDAFRFTVAGVPRTGQGERLRPWLVERQLRMPAENESLEALVAFLLAAGGEETAFDILRRRAGAEPPEPFAASLLERALVERGRAREAFEAAGRQRDAAPGRRGIREELRFAALAIEAGEPTVAADTLARVTDAAATLAPGAALSSARLAERLPEEVAARDRIIILLAIAAARESAPERLAAASIATRVAARRYGRQGSEEARREFDRCVSLAIAAASASGWDESAVAIFLESAQALVDDEDLVAAAELLSATVRADPAMPAPVAGRLTVAACALLAVSGDRWERSLELLRLVRSRGARPFSREDDPAEIEAEAIHRLSSLHLLVDDRIGHDRLLEKALALDPDHARSLNNLAYSAIDRGEIDAETVRRAERAHELAPRDASVLDTIGWLRYKQGRFRDDASGPGAVTLLARSIEPRPADPGLEPLDHLGDALWRAGEREAAIQTWTKAARLFRTAYSAERMQPVLLEFERREYGLRLVDVADSWRRSYGEVGERAARKAATAAAGGEPAVAPLAASAPGT